ncbi:MAG: hypothetical protein QOK40_3298 [Miltoncostaeaceae bacterium]|jgi:hypothetical protein|nr:hypothetical protein [Miltoncostaeaceae bacterium]
MIFSYTAPGRLESPEGYAIVRVAGAGSGWEIHCGSERLGRPWVAASSGQEQSLREARRHAEAHQRYMAASSGRPGAG